MNCETTNVSRKQLSDLFRVHINTVDSWIKAGLTHKKDGREYRFDLADVILWHSNFIANVSSDLPSMAEARRCREYYQAELKRLQYETQEGDLLHKDTLIKLWLPVITAMKQRLLAMPSKLTPMLYGCKTKPEMHTCLKKHIDEALAELSDDRMYLKPSKKKKGKK